MKKLQKEIVDLRERYEIGLSACGLDSTNVDYDKLSKVRGTFDEKVKQVFEKFKDTGEV